MLNKLIRKWAEIPNKWPFTVFLAMALSLGLFYSKTAERMERITQAMNQSKEILESFRVSPPRARFQ